MRIKKMCAALTVLFLLTIALPPQALAVSSDADILNYLQTFSKKIITDDGDKFTLRYNLDELTETELSYTIDHIAEVGTTYFEQEVFGDTSELDIQRGFTTIAPLSLESRYVNFPDNGTRKYSNSEYILMTFEKGHTMEYTEDISITVICRNGVVAGIQSFSFNLGSLPSYGTYTVHNMNTDYSSNSAGFSATYTVTKTIYAPVGDFSVPIAEYSAKTSASLLLLRA